MLIKAILVALLATGSQWWFSHLNHKNLAISDLVRFPYRGNHGRACFGYAGSCIHSADLSCWITAGGSMPGNLMVAGITVRP